MPERIQRRRTAGWRLPEGARIVDRTTRFGNPFTVADALRIGFGDTEPEARETVVDYYRAWLRGSEFLRNTYTVGAHNYDRRWVLANLGQLAGRDLACPCPLDQPCHASVLIELSNPGAP